MTRLIMLGGPGSGKGTQSYLLGKNLKLPVVATGDILRNAIDAKISLGMKAKQYLEKGELVPDRMMVEFIKTRLSKSDISQGWILEGYPRTAFQAEELDFLLADFGQELDWAIYLKVEPETMLHRSLQRPNIDAKENIIKRRIELFNQRTIPILGYYEYKQKLLTISAEDSIDQVNIKIINELVEREIY